MAAYAETVRITHVERQHALVMGEVRWDRLPREAERWYAVHGGERITEVRLLYGSVNRSVPGPTFVLWIWDQGPSSRLAEVTCAREELVFANDDGMMLRGSGYEARGEWSVFSTDLAMPEEMPPRVRIVTHEETIELDEPEHAMARTGFSVRTNEHAEDVVRRTLAAGVACTASFC